MGSLFAVTAPVYLLIALGFGAVRFGALAPADVGAIGRLVARFGIPALLLRTLAHQSGLSAVPPGLLAAYGVGSFVVLAGVAWFSSRVLGRPASLAWLQGLGAANSNSAFIGLPIVTQLLGPAAAIALVPCSLVENLLVIPLSLAMAGAGDHRDGTRPGLAAPLRGVVRNPMVLAILAGLAVSAAGIGIPAVLDRAIGLLAAVAPGAALFAIGGSLVGLRLSGIRSEIALVAAGKLVLHPLCVFAMLQAVPVPDPALGTAMLLYAAMPMLSIYPVLAQRFGHERFTAAALLATTLASFVTVSLLVGSLAAGSTSR